METLLSEEVQKELDSIGMFSVKSGETLRTVSAFTDGASLSAMRDVARGSEAIKNLDKFLKNV